MLLMTPRVSILLIRENAEQLTGSGCCGKLEGDQRMFGGGAVFAEQRRQARDLGVLHRAVRQFFQSEINEGLVTIEVVDPRNQLYLVPKLWKDAFRYRPGFVPVLQTALQLFAVPAVIVNGRIMSRRGVPVDPDTLCHAVGSELGYAAEGEFSSSTTNETT